MPPGPAGPAVATPATHGPRKPAAAAARYCSAHTGSAALEHHVEIHYCTQCRWLLRAANREMHLRRALRREAGVPAYRPTRLEPSPQPPQPRQLNE